MKNFAKVRANVLRKKFARFNFYPRLMLLVFQEGREDLSGERECTTHM